MDSIGVIKDIVICHCWCEGRGKDIGPVGITEGLKLGASGFKTWT